MKSVLARLILLLAAVVAQQGAFAVAYANDLGHDHQQLHTTGGACEDCRYLASASGALSPDVLLPVCSAAVEAPVMRAVDVAVQAVTVAYSSRAPPSLSL